MDVPFLASLAGLAALAAGLAIIDALGTPNALGDPLFFHAAGNLIANGHGYVRPEAFQAGHHTVATALHPPLYPLLVAAVSVLGVTDFSVQRAVLGGLLAGAIAICAGLLGRRLGGRGVGLIAAGLAALMPSLVAAAGSGESEPLFGVIMLATLVLAYRAIDRPTVAAAVGVGALVGLATLTRSEGVILLAIPLIGAWLGRAERGNWWRLAATLVACAVVVTPWLIRNDYALGRPVLSTNVGTLLAGANCGPVYSGSHIGDWVHCFAPLQPGPTSRDEARWSSALAARGLTYARHHAGRLPAVLVARATTVWSLGRLPSWDRPFLMSAGFHWAAIAFYFPVLLLGVTGAVMLRRRGTSVAFMLVPLFLTTAIALLGWGSTRFRYTGELALVVLAAVALRGLVRVPALGRVARAPGQL